MTYMTLFHWLLVVVVVLIYSGTLVLIFLKLKGQVLAIAFFVLTIFSLTALFMGIISLDRKLKKAQIEQFDNKRLLSNEQIIFSGYVVNTGNYTIGTVTFKLKLINKGLSVGNVKGTDFYQPNSFLEMLFTIGESKTKEAKPSTIEIERIVAKNLKPKERRAFSFSIGFPTYFKDVLFREKLVLDLKE